MSSCYWNQRRTKAPVLEIETVPTTENLPQKAPVMHTMDVDTFGVKRRILPPYYYSDFSDSESDSEDSESEKINLFLQKRLKTTALPLAAASAQQMARDWKA